VIHLDENALFAEVKIASIVPKSLSLPGSASAREFSGWGNPLIAGVLPRRRLGRSRPEVWRVYREAVSSKFRSRT
jgi:hypothetical protein